MSLTIKPLLSLAVATAGAVTALTIIWAVQSGTDPAMRPPLTTSQGAFSSVSGFAVRLHAATFSGTGTWVEVEISPTSGRTLDDIVALSVPPEALRQSTLYPIDAGDGRLTLPRGGGPTILRFAPLESGQEEAMIVIESLDLELVSGEVQRVNGRWVLPLVIPEDIEPYLRREELQATGEANDSGISVRVLSAIRSSSEMTITVEVTSDSQVTPLSEATLSVNGVDLTGGIAREMEGGRLLEFIFPPSPFGTSAELSLGPWTSARTSADVATDVDMAKVLARAVPDAEGNTNSPVTRFDVLSINRDSTPVRSVQTAAAMINGILVPTLQVTLSGNFEGSDEPMHIVFEDGTRISAVLQTSAYRKDLAGTISSGQSVVTFPLGDIERWHQVIRLYHGVGNAVTRGTWTIGLVP